MLTIRYKLSCCLYVWMMLILSPLHVMAEPLTLYVAPYGDSQADGLTAKVDGTHGPLRTLSDARNTIRRLHQEGDLSDQKVVVQIAPGRYFLNDTLEMNQSDSGQLGAQIVYRGAGPDTTVISGAIELQQPVDLDGLALSLLPDSAKSNVLCFNLEKLDGMTALPGFSAGGAGFKATRDYSLQLSQNGKRLALAQWPNDGFARTGEYLGSFTGAGVLQKYRSGIFHFQEPRIKIWAQEPDLWLYGQWFYHWADQIMTVKNIDLDKQTIELDRPDTHYYGYHSDRPFIAVNAISELDHPGEWAVDRRRRRLYVWPISDITRDPLRISIRESLLEINKASDIRFEGLTFEAARANAINLNQCERITFARCVIRHTGAWAMQINGGSDCAVVGCDIYDLGEGGVSMNGGDLKTLTPAKHRVENCYIHHFGRIIATYQTAIQLKGVGSIARNNLIHDSNHAGILFDGNDHLIEYNIIHDVLLHTSDAGAIYGCARNWAKRGTVIRYNMVHGLGAELDGAGCRGIYLDDYTSAVTIHGNIVTMASIGIHVGGGQDNVVTNNLVMQSFTGLNLANKGIDGHHNGYALKGTESQVWKSTLSYPINSPIWKSHYPGLQKWMKGDPGKAHSAFGNTFENNISAGSGPLRVANIDIISDTTILKNNLEIEGDPGLVDVMKPDFNLKPDSTALKQNPDFDALPVDKMGLYASEDRASSPRRFGPDVKALPAFVTIEQLRATLPKYNVQRVNPNQIVVDGVIDNKEWNLSSIEPLHCKVGIGGGVSDYDAIAYVAVDNRLLNIAIKIKIDPGKPLVMGGTWGSREGLEFAYRDPSVKTNPTYLVQCFPDGTFASIPGMGVSTASAQMQMSYMKYAAKVHEDYWVCEISINMHSHGFDAKKIEQMLFNINIRRTSDQSWMAWTPMRGGFRDVERSGMLIFPEY